MMRVIKSILVAGCVFTTVVNGVVIYDAINSIAHAGERFRNYDADGNLTGYSERETEAETNARIMGEYYQASASAAKWCAQGDNADCPR